MSRGVPTMAKGPRTVTAGAARRAHVDYTAKSGPRRVADILGAAEAGRLAASGARIIQVNVWRPIRGPVLRAPLALADASSVEPDELVVPPTGLVKSITWPMRHRNAGTTRPA